MAAAQVLHPDEATLRRRSSNLEMYLASRRNWESHKDAFGPESLAGTLVFQIHDHFRQAFKEILDLVDARRARGETVLVSPEVISAVHWRVRTLLVHYEKERARFYPLLRRREPSVSNKIDELEKDLDRVHPLEGFVLGLSGPTTDDVKLAALQELVSMVEDFLNQEELVVVPVLLKHSDRAYWY